MWLPPKILGTLLEKIPHRWGKTITLKWTIRGRLHGEFQPGLKFSCDYIANFSSGAMFKIGRETFIGKRFTFTTQAVRMPRFICQPGLKFECDYMRFFSLVSQTGNFSPGWNSLQSQTSFWEDLFRKPSWNLSPANRAEFSVRAEICHVIGPLVKSPCQLEVPPHPFGSRSQVH